MDRRRFLKISAAAAAVGIASIATSFGFLSLSTKPRSSRITSSSSMPNYPTGSRVVRIRPLQSGSQWILPNNYTATDVLNWISDLKPTTLQRFCTGRQNPSALVPTSDGSSMTVLDFLQKCLDNMTNVDNTSMFHRISADELSQGTFFKTAQNLWSLNQQLDPPQTLVSIDNLHSDTPPSTVSQIVQGLYQIGYDGIALGACGDVPFESGQATFSLVCVDTSTWQPQASTIQNLRTEGIRATTAIELQIDFPAEIQSFEAQGSDAMANIMESLAKEQSSLGYVYTYDIAEGNYDAHQFVTTRNGNYWTAGDSLYTVCKNLLNAFS
jgi:hypothetical protein